MAWDNGENSRGFMGRDNGKNSISIFHCIHPPHTHDAMKKTQFVASFHVNLKSLMPNLKPYETSPIEMRNVRVSRTIKMDVNSFNFKE